MALAVLAAPHASTLQWAGARAEPGASASAGTMVGGAVIVVNHSVVSNAFKPVEVLAFLPVVFGARCNIRLPDAVWTALHRGLLDIGAAAAAFVEREPATGAVR